MNSVPASDTLEYKAIGGVQLSPDGNSLCYTVSEPFRIKGESKARSSIWIRMIKDDLTHCISDGLAYASDPKWSPDCRKVGFIGQTAPESTSQLYLFDVASGRTLQSTKLEGEIEQFEWSQDNNRLFVLMKEKSDITDDPEEYEHGTEFSNLYLFELDSGRMDRLSREIQVWEFALSPDSRSIAALVSHEPHEWAWHIAEIALIDIESRSLKILVTPAPRQVGDLKWSPNGKEILYISSIISDRGLIGGDLVSVSPFSRVKPTIIAGDSIGTIHSYEFVDERRLVILSVNLSRAVFSLLDLKNKSASIIEKGDFWIDPIFHPRFSYNSSKNMIAVIREDLENQQEIWTGKISHDAIAWNRETKINEKQKNLLKGSCDLVEWKSFDGELIQGFLHSPLGNKDKTPLIVNIHGGPSASYGFRFDPNTKFFLSRGFSVFLPNPRGSTGRGTRFSEMNRGNIDGDDFKDILAGIDHLVKSGRVDGSNLFVMGGSYGGYLVAWAITHSDIFNAAVMNFGISNLMSCHGTEWNTYWDRYIFDIDPYKDPEKYHRKSAINYVERVKTPTLIMHGKEDPCVPVTQGIELFRALKELGKETRMIIYPREKHGWNERDHILDALNRQTQWFESHLAKLH